MVNIYDLNTTAENKGSVETLKKDFERLFYKVYDAEICIVSNFPSPTNSFGAIDLLIFVNIPYREGNYYGYKDGEEWHYLNSLVIAIKKINDNSITNVDNSFLYNSDGIFNYKEDLDNESSNFGLFARDALNSSFYCISFYWVNTSSYEKSEANEYLILNKDLDIRALLEFGCKRRNSIKSCSCLPKEIEFNTTIKTLIEAVNQETNLGILTQNKINQITKKTKITERISQLEGTKLCLITGKAGCGKTLALTRALYEIASQGHKARLLTFNNLLVFDIKQCLRNLGPFQNTNVSIRTLHKFFFDLSEKMGVQAFFTYERLQELTSVCKRRVESANKFLENYKECYGSWPKDVESILDKYKDEIEYIDRKEIIKYIECFLNKNEKEIDIIKKEYLNHHRELLIKKLGSAFFRKDYDKVMETIYSILNDPKSFYEKNNIKDRHDYLVLLDKTERKDSEEKECSFEDFSKLIKGTTRAIKWSNSIIIDEAQDCNRYEKMIIMNLRGTENLIVASGGKDQLIRSSRETSWKRTISGAPVAFEEIKLGNKCYRQKANIVEFVNNFCKYFSLSDTMQSIAESKGLGEVIIDTRVTEELLPMDIIRELKSQGEAYGCSAYENLMFLLPHIGYTSKTTKESIQIDSNDNVDIIQTSTNRHLEIHNEELNIWDGTIEEKYRLKIPGQNQTRFIHYESCRGLEAWSIFCMDLDVFFYHKKDSKDADDYALEQNSLFSEKEDLKSRYALLSCLMAFTRPIDTLYLKIKDPTNDFAQSLLKIAELCGNIVTIIK